jgi:hypothetical protein
MKPIPFLWWLLLASLSIHMIFLYLLFSDSLGKNPAFRYAMLGFLILDYGCAAVLLYHFTFGKGSAFGQGNLLLYVVAGLAAMLCIGEVYHFGIYLFAGLYVPLIIGCWVVLLISGFKLYRKKKPI